MNPKSIRALSYVGVLLTLFLSIWYFMKTFNEGSPKWIFMIMAFGIAILLSLNLFKGGKRKD
jgi:hypothetical protein